MASTGASSSARDDDESSREEPAQHTETMASSAGVEENGPPSDDASDETSDDGSEADDMGPTRETDHHSSGDEGFPPGYAEYDSKIAGKVYRQFAKKKKKTVLDPRPESKPITKVKRKVPTFIKRHDDGGSGGGSSSAGKKNRIRPSDKGPGFNFFG